MGDIGGESLDGDDTFVERPGHVAQGLGEIADFVAAVREMS